MEVSTETLFHIYLVMLGALIASLIGWIVWITTKVILWN